MTTDNYTRLPAWRAACALAARCEIRSESLRTSAGETLGSFSYALVKSRLFGARLISLPFSDESGVHLEKPGREAEAACALRGVLDRLAADAVSAELRGASPVLDAAPEVFRSSAPYVRFELDLTAGWEKLRSAYHTNIIKNLEQAGRRLETDLLERPGRPELRELYRIYLSQMSRFGSPPLPMEYFSAMADSGLYIFFRARLKSKAIAFLAAIPYGGTLRADINASLPGFDSFFPKVRLFDESVRWASARGFGVYDFMRTRRGTGVHTHKARWGGTEKEIIYYTHGRGPGYGREPDPADPALRLASIGLRLLPLALLEKIGPVIRAGAAK